MCYGIDWIDKLYRQSALPAPTAYVPLYYSNYKTTHRIHHTVVDSYTQATFPAPATKPWLEVFLFFLRLLLFQSPPPPSRRWGRALVDPPPRLFLPLDLILRHPGVARVNVNGRR